MLKLLYMSVTKRGKDVRVRWFVVVKKKVNYVDL